MPDITFPKGASIEEILKAIDSLIDTPVLTKEQRLAKFEEDIIERYDPAKRDTPAMKFDAELSRDLQIMLARKHEAGHDKYGLETCLEVSTVMVACLMKSLGATGAMLVEDRLCTAQDLGDYVVASIRAHCGEITKEEFKAVANSLIAKAGRRPS